MEDNNDNNICTYYDKLDNISIPIITITGLYENTNKFHTSLVMVEQLINNGYKVSVVGTREYSDVFGFNIFPHFMYNPKIDEIQKVYLFNKFIKNIEINEKPDIILITIPGAIQNLSEKFLGRFGILQYITFKSILPDYSIMCTFFEYDSKELLKIISESCFYKFGFYVDCYHMSDYFIDYTMSKEKGEIVSNNVGSEIVTDHLKRNYLDAVIPVLNLYDDEDKLKIYNLLITKLSE